MTDLVEFLRARLDEDERDAQEIKRLVEIGLEEPGAVTYSPARVLREVEAKRRIIDEHDTQKWKPGDRVHDCQWEEWPCATLRLLALPYADHPEFREEWKL